MRSDAELSLRSTGSTAVCLQLGVVNTQPVCPVRAVVAIIAVAIPFWLDIVQAKHVVYYGCKLFLRSSVNDMFFRSCDVIGVENLPERLGRCRAQSPAQEHAEATDVRLKALYKVGTTGVEKIISSSQSWLQADKKDIQARKGSTGQCVTLILWHTLLSRNSHE